MVYNLFHIPLFHVTEWEASAMKTIGVVAMREDTGIFFKTQLDSLFEGEIKVNRYALGSAEEKISIQEESKR